MNLLTALSLLTSLTSASLLPALPVPQYLFANPPNTSTTGFRIPTIHESAIQARRILHLSRLATLSTIFPSSSSSSSSDLSPSENRPASVGDSPIGLLDYIASCAPSPADPTLLALSIATSFKNAAAGSNISLSLRWTPPSHSTHYSAAALPRFALIGTLEDLTPDEVRDGNVAQCFLAKHPDARAWLPGNRIHESRWARVRVREVYWVGGFGDRAYIGWIPREEWEGVSKEEVDRCRLPGEKERSGSGWWRWRSWVGLGEGEGQGVLEL